MKSVTNNYKTNIKTFGREFDSIITYEIDNEEIEIGNEDLNSISLNYEGGLLKSVMKQLVIDSNEEIPLNTIINFKFGLKIEDSFEYIDYGNFIVYEIEKQEDLRSWKIKCYDKMLYSMINYESMNITYPITIKNYISAICTKLGLTFANTNDTFANYNREINREIYLDTNNNSIGYTFRDVLDELAEVTASTICINNNDELEIRYINNTNEGLDEESLKNINVNFGEKFGPVNVIVLSRSAGADNIYYPAELPENPCELKIEDNQIMNGNDRNDYMPDIYNQLNGLEYYVNDFASIGITYLELCDKYNITVDSKTYSCILFNDEINIKQGLEENIFTKNPDEDVTNYKYASTTDKKLNTAYIMAKKNESEIEAVSRTVDYNSNSINEVNAKLTSQDLKIDIISTNIDTESGNITEVTTTNGFTFNSNGLNVSSSNEGYNTQIDTQGTYYKDGNTILSQTTKDGTITKDLALYGTYYYGINDNVSIENFTKDDAMFVAMLYNDNNNEQCFGHFYNGSD